MSQFAADKMTMFRTSITCRHIVLCLLLALCRATYGKRNQVSGLAETITVFENGDCNLECSIPYRYRHSVVWVRNGEENPITLNQTSVDDKLYSIALYAGDFKDKDQYYFKLTILKVSLKDNGSTYACVAFNTTNNRTKLFKSSALNVIQAPGSEYPKCSGKPMNSLSKTFSLSCCTEKVAQAGIKLEWKYSSGNRIPDHKPMDSKGGSGQFCIHHNLTSVHNGASYLCHLSAAGGSQGLNRSCRIQYQKPDVKLKQMDSQQAKFTCSAAGADSYQWSLGDGTNSKSNQYVLEAGSSSVMILNLNSVHNGTFITCTATGKETMGSDGIMLIMGRPSAKEQSMTLILGLVMGTVAGLLAIILVIYLIKMNALQKCCCGENDFSSLEFRTIIRMRGSQNTGNGGPSSYYVVQSTSAGTSSMHPLMSERDSSNSRLSTSGYQSDNDSLHAVGAVGGAVGGAGFAGNYYELRKPPRPGGSIIRGATSRDYYNDPCPGPRTPPRPPKPGLTDPRKLNVEGLDYADLDLVNVAEEEEDVPTKLPEEQTEYADILRIPSLRHSSIS